MRGNITKDYIDIRRIIKEYYEQLYVNNIHNLDEMESHWHLICI